MSSKLFGNVCMRYVCGCGGLTVGERTLEGIGVHMSGAEVRQQVVGLFETLTTAGERPLIRLLMFDHMFADRALGLSPEPTQQPLAD